MGGLADPRPVVAPPVRDRRNPSLFEALLADPTLPLDRGTLERLVRDLQRPSRRYLRPLLRPFALLAVGLIVLLKRVLPFQFSSHGALDALSVWFLRRFASPEACWLLLRHFSVETAIVNFIVVNSGAEDIEACRLTPRAIGDLRGHAVIQHDRNVYNLFLDLGASRTADVLSRRATKDLDFSMLGVPEIDASLDRKRLLNLDIETALYLMNVPFCLFTTEPEYERAVNSFQFDESLLACIANLTGDVVFRTWTPLKFPIWLSLRRDVPRDLFWHAAVHEYAHRRLCDMRDVLSRGETWPPERGARP